MWVRRKDWERLVARVEELESNTSMTSYAPSGGIAAWMRQALPINQIVERLAQHAGLTHRVSNQVEWKFNPDSTGTQK